jgi:hypothetical protein
MRTKTYRGCLRGACYDVDALWSRASRELAKATLLVLFLLVMVSGTIAIAAGGFAVQVQLTGLPASAVIDPG